MKMLPENLTLSLILQKRILVSLLGIVLLCSAGCGYPKEFVDVVNDHRKLSVETLTALEDTVKEDMRKMADQGTLTETGKQQALDLLARLDMLKKQSVDIDQYVSVSVVDQKLLSQLLRDRWNKEIGK